MPRLRPSCDDIHTDKFGNVIGRIGGKGGGKKIMIFAHMDSIGFIVRRIQPDGYIQVDRLGGISEKVLPGLRLVVRSEDGRWHPGVFAVKSHHAMTAEEKYKVDPIRSMCIDVGAVNARDVRDMGIEVGCPAVFEPSAGILHNGRIAGTFVDNRGGCAVLTDVAKRLYEIRPADDVYLVGTVWEEFNLRGAMMVAQTVHPDIAISIDVTLSGDTADLADLYEDTLGEGACVQLYSFHGRGTLNGTLPHEPLYRHVANTAKRAKIPLQRFASLGILTDMSYVQLVGGEPACLETGFSGPLYTHAGGAVRSAGFICAVTTANRKRMGASG